MSDKIFFFHNPKAGGSSIRSILESRIPPEKRCPRIENDKVEHEKLCGDYKPVRGFALYAGHYGRDIFTAVCDDHLAITNFRHPATRLISLYNYFRYSVDLPDEELRTDRFYAVLFAKSVCFDEFISADDARVAVYTQDAHFRQLANSCWSLKITRQFHDVCQFIDSMPWYYVCEYPELSLFWARRTFGWDLNRMPTENVTRDQGGQLLSLATLNDNTYTGIYMKNKFDFDLYKYAVDRFLTRTSIWSDYCKVRSANKIYSPRTAMLSNEIDPYKLEELTPDSASVEKRIEIATRCRDMDDITRVPGAGEVQTLADGTRAQIMHNGVRILADGYQGEWMTRLIELCHGCHEPQEERVFHEIMLRIPAEATMIELGGYWSFYSLWFLSQGRDRRSIIVEPDPKHLAVGQTNARLNGFAPTFMQAFVGETPSTPVPFKTTASGEMLLPRLSVPSLIESQAIGQLHVLHCDIQGAEFEVLRSCEQLFKQHRIQFVFVSTHDFRICGDPLMHQRCLTVILNCGGQIIAEHDVYESYSGDGLIVACFGSDRQSGAPVSISFNRYSESLFRNPLYDLAAVRGNTNP